ncbi:MAG: bifunctional enoyl-CoA hydratase/phosphate acetyltransferase [Zoogloea sp.]|nr:bifunctional enoyl-CoA hydratase/phosphate acetyltransferase [Zoogloea sp.]
MTSQAHDFIQNRTFDEIAVGDSALLVRTLRPEDIHLFAVMSGDVNPTHVDPEFARSSQFREVVGHSMWGSVLISSILGTEFPGPGTVYVGQTLKFWRPITIGDTLTVTITCTQRFEHNHHLLLDCQCVNQDGLKVIDRIIDVPHSHASAETAVRLARNGEVEALMKGSLHTDELMSEVVSKETGLRTARRLSHVFMADVPTYPHPLLITDAAINIEPTLADKVHIIQNAIELAIMMGVPEPKVAILSAVETVNEKIRSTLDAAALCKMADRGQIKGGLLDGPLAFDNAVSLVAAKTKGIRSAVAGQADILVVPDLESGNMVAKQLEYLADALMAGVVLGARVPIVLTSRADTAETRTASCAIAQLMAHKRRQGVRL